MVVSVLYRLKDLRGGRGAATSDSSLEAGGMGPLPKSSGAQQPAAEAGSASVC